MLTSRPKDNSLSIPAGPITEQPVTKFPSINAVGAKRRAVWVAAGLCMQGHVGHLAGKIKAMERAALLRLVAPGDGSVATSMPPAALLRNGGPMHSVVFFG